MTLQNLFVLNSVISTFFSLALLLMPGAILDLFGFSGSEDSMLLIQFFGAQLLGGGLITLFALNTKELRSQRSLTLSYLIANSVGFMAALGGMLKGVMNPLGWIFVILYLALALGFGYFQFIGS